MSTTASIAAPSCKVPSEYVTVLSSRGFQRETPEVKLSWWKRLRHYAPPTPTVFRANGLDLRFVWDRIIEAEVGPAGAAADEWVALEHAVPFALGKPLYVPANSGLTHSHYAQALNEHFDAIARIVSRGQLPTTKKAILDAARVQFPNIKWPSEA